jgi:hypothetical protein
LREKNCVPDRLDALWIRPRGLDTGVVGRFA